MTPTLRVVAISLAAAFLCAVLACPPRREDDRDRLDGGTSAADAGDALVCADDAVDGGVADGVVDCVGGARHRVSVVSCPPPPDFDLSVCDPGVESDCLAQTDCGDGSLCTPVVDGFCACSSSCSVDTDCGDGFACLCPFCVPAGCHTADDCGGEPCGIVFDQEGSCVQTQLAGHGVDDECRVEADCGGGRCVPQNGRWRCDPFQCRT